MPRVVIAKWYRRTFPTTKVQKLMPQMPFVIPDEPVRVRSSLNEEHLRRLFPWQMRLKEIAKSVTRLIDEERSEFSYYRAYETRCYTERLISEAIRYGDCHKETMELANFYLLDKTLIHKLFKVLVPRYLNYTSSFTSMHLLPVVKKDWSIYKPVTQVGQKVMIELKGNPYPRLFVPKVESKNLLHNILLSEAAKEYYKQKAIEDNSTNEPEIEEKPEL